jgi:hypothetical protein
MNLARKLDFPSAPASGTPSQLTPHSGEAVVLPDLLIDVARFRARKKQSN